MYLGNIIKGPGTSGALLNHFSISVQTPGKIQLAIYTNP